MTNKIYIIGLVIWGTIVVVALLSSSARLALIRSWKNLYGIATPDGTHPTGRRISLFRSKLVGAALTAVGFVTAYYFVLRPIAEAKLHNGELHQGIFGLCMPAMLLYGGIATLVLDLRDEKSLRIAENGRLRFTRTARLVELGTIVAVAVACIAWYLYVRFQGLDLYLGEIPLPR